MVSAGSVYLLLCTWVRTPLCVWEKKTEKERIKEKEAINLIFAIMGRVTDRGWRENIKKRDAIFQLKSFLKENSISYWQFPMNFMIVKESHEKES